MPKTEEVTAPTEATAEEIENISKCFKFTGSPYLSEWESRFIESLYNRQQDMFTQLLSKKQRYYLAKIWEKLYDRGLIT